MAEAGPACALRTLKGTYVYKELWANWSSCSGAPAMMTLSQLFTLTFDGEGSFTVDGTEKRVEACSGSSTETQVSQSGTYTVDPDCTATLSIPNGSIVVMILLRGDIFLVKEPVPFLTNENMIGIGIHQ